MHPKRILFKNHAYGVFLLVVVAVIATLQSVSASGTLAPLLPGDVQISTTTSDLDPARIAFDGTNYLVVFGESGDVYGRFVDTTGNTAGSPFPIVAINNNQSNPTVAFNGTHYLVVWDDNFGFQSGDSIYAQVVSTSGQLLGSPILISFASNSRFNSQVASDGNNFLVIWTDNRNFNNGPEYGNTMGQIVSVDGTGTATLDGGNFMVSPASGHQFFPAVGYGNSVYLVTWTEDPVPNQGLFDIYGATVDGAGNVSSPITINTASSSQGNRESGISFDGTNFLVVMDDNRNGSNDIYGARVSEAGALLDGPPATGGIQISASPGFGSPSRPKVAFDGTDWLVVWAGTQVEGVRVSSTGTVLDATAIDFFVTSGSHWDPDVAFDGTNFLVSWRNQNPSNNTFIQLVGMSGCSTSVTNVNDSGAGSLRDAIDCANTTVGLDTIDFNIAGTSPFTIQPLSALPTITEEVIIDGTTQLGYVDAPVIEIDGSLAGAGADGLNITSGDSTVRGLVINNFGSDGIAISIGGNNVIEGNYIGTDTSGTSALGNGSDGILITDSANNLIGTDGDGTNDSAERNIISANGSAGVVIVGVSSTDNVVAGNYIGTNATGDSALGHVLSGVVVAAPNNIIGGTTPGTGNLLSGNTQNGVRIDTGATGTPVQGNLVGTDATGTVAVPNQQVGVRIFESNNTVGGSVTGARNIISGNGQDGVRIDAGATNNVIQGNYVGTDVSGTLALTNLSDGVEINATSGNTVDGNVLSGNGANGVRMLNVVAGNNLITGNMIGTDATGTTAIGNGVHGIRLVAASGNTIGGTTAAARNIISGNIEDGVTFEGSGGPTTSNVVQGNYIGTDVSGSNALGNGQYGVRIHLSSNANTVGGTTAAERNIISGNGNSGIYITNEADNNLVQGNYIGTDVTGTSAVTNSGDGIGIVSGTGNIVGGDVAGTGNVISGNGGNGVQISNTTTDSNTVAGNLIGTNANGTAALGNTFNGVRVVNTADNTIGGTVAGARNVIAGNGTNGIEITGFSATSNQIQGNYVGIDTTGTSALGNLASGVLINGAASNNTVGGTVPEARNIVSGNGVDGIRVFSNSHGNVIQGNYVGTDITGTTSLGNVVNGIYINFSNTTVVSDNVTSGNGEDGIVAVGNDNVVTGNLVGVDTTGSAALGNVRYGILSTSSNNLQIGGATAQDRNVVSGNGDNGINVVSNSAAVVQGNYVGTDITGTTALGNGGTGIFINISENVTASDNLVSGNSDDGIAVNASDDSVISDNTMTGNDGDGIRIASGTGNLVSSNAIYNNGDLGIDLGSSGVTVNDAGDGDAGANNLQNYPVVSATYSGTTETVVDGTLNSTANTTFQVQVYANSACDPSGYGEGETFIGSDSIVTDGAGDVTFSISLPVATSIGDVLTVTATDPDGNTSEFSECLTTVALDTTPPDITANVVGTLGDNNWYTSNVDVTWTVTEPESPVSLVTTDCGPTTISTDTR